MGSEHSSEMSKEVLKFEGILNYKFLPPINDDTDNGLYLNNIYIPEEVLLLLLSYVDPNDLLKLSLVCRKWCKIIKSHSLWSLIYGRTYNEKPKKLPWYVYYCLFATKYFNVNLLKNGNGEEQFKYWHINKNYGDEFKIEDPPQGADPLPKGLPEFHGKTSCFATSFYECDKEQRIKFKSKLLLYVVNRYRPSIYVSEWVTGRFDSSSVYKLTASLIYADSDVQHSDSTKHVVQQWQENLWTKKEIVLKDYPKGVLGVVFQHVGHDTLFWKGHYGTKMAGGIVMLQFDSMEPLEEDIESLKNTDY